MSEASNEHCELTGFVEHIIYRNDENGYTVLSLDSDITVTGIFPQISEGESLRLWGIFVFHSVYGEQFKCESFEIITPESEDEIRRYLASGAIPGIGAGLAGRIVEKFHERTFEIMEYEPERLAEVRGISEKKAIAIADVFLEKTRDRAAILYLMKYGIKNNLAVKIYKYYGSKIYQVIENNPYRMAEDIKGVGFKIADDIANKTGIRYDQEYRTKSGILFVLNQNSLIGHTYLPYDSLLNQCKNLLNTEKSIIEAALMTLSIEKKIIIRGERIYLSYFYKMEEGCASMLLGLNIPFPEDKKFAERFNTDLDIEQRNAVSISATNGVTVLTGGPGTGKTTTIKAMIEYFTGIGLDIVLCAPTGRAAKRMTESTGVEAMTVHRLLEVKRGVDNDSDSTNIFLRGEDYPIETDVIIIDEASMMDIILFYHLLKAIPLDTRLILVGDANQLPSVGPGNVLRDIINSECFPVVRLTKIFRQEKRSDIVINAHKIQNDEDIVLSNESCDFFFLKRETSQSVISTVLTLIKKKLPAYVESSEGEIQVLTPTRKGKLGVESLNITLQEYLNPRDGSIEEQGFGDRIFRVRDKVMQTKNNYQMPWRILGEHEHVIEEGIGVFNGDIGIIRNINSFAKLITVEFDDGRVVDYPFNQADELEHAFALTVHKSQGSEYPAIVIPLLNVPRMLMNRNLIYTAITRAKKCVVIVGDEEIFKAMVKNNSILYRYSGFCDAIIWQNHKS